MTILGVMNGRTPADGREGPCHRVLFVCTGGMLRSATAAQHFNKTRGWNTRTAGLAPNLAVLPVTDGVVAWADAIYCMEEWHANEIRTAMPQHAAKVTCLNIPDGFRYMQQELIDALEKAVGA